MGQRKEIHRREKIVLRLINKIRTKYTIVFWGVGGSTARGVPGADIDIAIQLKYLAEAKNGEEKSRRWHEFEKWTTPLLEEFKNKYGIEIDLEW